MHWCFGNAATAHAVLFPLFLKLGPRNGSNAVKFLNPPTSRNITRQRPDAEKKEKASPHRPLGAVAVNK